MRHLYIGRRRLLSLLLVVITILAGSVPAVAQDGGRSEFTVKPLNPVRVFDLNATKDGESSSPEAIPPSSNNLVSVIVKLDIVPLASYRGNVPGLAATSPEVTGAPQLDSRSPDSRRYLAYLDQRLRDFETVALASIPQARVTARYHHVFGGVAMVVPADQVDQVAKLPGVVSVQPDQLVHPTTDRSPQFIGAPTIWNALGGQDKAGEGVVVGVIDTGIWPEHPSFADDGSYPPPPLGWNGICEEPNDESPPIICTNKLIGARGFLDNYKRIIGLGPGEYDSARDAEGHGTHTTSTAAGNGNVTAEIFGMNRGTISGIAPRAQVAAYKACGAVGCLVTDLVAAINQAVADGVNVINYSISGGDEPYTDPTELAFLDAYAAGVFVAAAAGNQGPESGDINHAGGWVTTVAASTSDRHFMSTLSLQSGSDTLTLEGASITAGIPEFTQVVQNEDDPLCLDEFPAGSVAGKIVACERGTIARVEKGFNVLQGGAVGMILYNPTLADVETDNHWLPTVHLPDGEPFLDFLNNHSYVVAKFTEGASTTVQGDIIANFSSRGPTPDGAFIKPDITAPGVQILAGHAPEHRPDVVLGPPDALFQTSTGTSMSAPHIAGAGALLKALHPDWMPGQIKSALMTSAMFSTVVKEDEITPADPFDTGSGRVDLTKAGNPGLTFDVTALQYAAGETHPWDLNYPSIMIATMPGRFTAMRTAHSELDKDSIWDIETTAPSGVSITVSPTKLKVPAHGRASFFVTIEVQNIPDGTYFGSVDLSHGEIKVHMPVAFEYKQPVVDLTKSCDPTTITLQQTTGCALTITNTSFDPAVVSVKDEVPRGLDVIASSVTGADVDDEANTVTFNGRLPAATPGSVDVVDATGLSPAGYRSLATFVDPLPCTSLCDDAAVTLDVEPFTYGGVSYTRVTIVSNGYLIVGDDATIRYINQRFPDPARPNNVIAPYWTDLDLDGTSSTDRGGGTWFAATVSEGATDWFVAEWKDAAELRNPDTAHSFQIWIRLGTDEVFMTYGPNTPTPARLTTGAENVDGTAGDNYYVDLTSTGVDGEGTAPVEGTELAVETLPPTVGTHVITFSAEGVQVGNHVNTAEMTSNLFEGTDLASTVVTVTK